MSHLFLLSVGKTCTVRKGFNANHWSWNRAGEFLQALFRGKYKTLIKYTLPQRIATIGKAVDGMFIELGNKDVSENDAA